MGVNGPASKDTMWNYRTCTPGYCLATVWQAYKDNGAWSDGGYYPTAWSAWIASKYRHEGDMNPPVGVPVYLGQRGGYNGECGDVMISAGNGQCVATDWPYNGVINVCTIQDRLNQTGRPYCGWTEDILGCPIEYPGGMEDDMTPEQANQLNQIFNAIFYGGPSMPDGYRSIGQSLADIAAGRRPIVSRNDASTGNQNAEFIWIQELADAKTNTLAIMDNLGIGPTPPTPDGDPVASPVAVAADEDRLPSDPPAERDPGVNEPKGNG